MTMVVVQDMNKTILTKHVEGVKSKYAYMASSLVVSPLLDIHAPEQHYHSHHSYHSSTTILNTPHRTPYQTPTKLPLPIRTRVNQHQDG